MATTRVLVLRAPGINCDEETAFAWEQAGAKAERLHINELIKTPDILRAYQILTVPGGFSYGDDIASGKILANQLRHHLGDAVSSFVDQGGLVLGICNGFQVLVRLGLLPGASCDTTATLTLNDSGRYEARWVRLRVETDRCAFLERGDEFSLPVAHAEGKIELDGDKTALTMLTERGHVALRYICPDGKPPAYPDNPNGSIGDVAGLTDSTGRVLGLMPHPERNILPSHAPAKTSDSSIENAGCRLFQRAVATLR